MSTPRNDDDVWIIGSFSSQFGRHPDQSFKDLAREAVTGVLGDAALPGDLIESIWFGNCLMHSHPTASGRPQAGVRGQASLIEMVDDGTIPAFVPVTNVEGACATGSMAFQSAAREIRAGDVQVALALGVEKTWHAGAESDPEIRTRMFDAYWSGIDNFDVDRLLELYASGATEAGTEFDPEAPGRTLFMTTYATQAALHMHHYGTTVEQIAAGAAKNHTYGSLNPAAQYRFAMTVDQVLADRPVVHPLTRAMCAPIGDGAAAALVCSSEMLASLDEAVRSRAIRVAASSLTGGRYRSFTEPGLSAVAAQRAYQRSGYQPSDIDVAEVHDATSFCEILQVEMLGFCETGQGGSFVGSGATGPEGPIPVNTSGGLVSKGHPVGATGLSMIHELVTQLRHEAGPRQVANARVALAENGGGVIGFEEAACAVTILDRPQ
jgi:acetyl-CoA acetyltransferase